MREFGLKAFRRPLDADEQKRYETLMSRETDFLKGAQLVMEAMLQSSNFLFRLDDTTDPKWRPYVAASRLSYSLWDTMPDAALLRRGGERRAVDGRGPGKRRRGACLTIRGRTKRSTSSSASGCASTGS